MLRILNMFVEKAARDRAEKLGITYKPALTWWQRVDRKLTNATPLEKEATIMLDHNYDGIKELDNHLPPWWKWLFYFTIGWSAIYLIAYHVTDTWPLMEQEYGHEVAAAQEKINAFRANQPTVQIDEGTLEYTADVELISSGRKVFDSQCVSCHRNDGGGGIGPNLTDEYWLHGGTVSEIYSTVKNGVPEKGMISWAPVLRPEEIRNVTFFIMSIRGTNPLNGKAPQGELFKTETAKPDSASTKSQASL
ncbi:MAG: c-type cytochrome [Bacteroidia bacterium]|nr:c-type cytochrome [Bacteroidia bacterium]